MGQSAGVGQSFEIDERLHIRASHCIKLWQTADIHRLHDRPSGRPWGRPGWPARSPQRFAGGRRISGGKCPDPRSPKDRGGSASAGKRSRTRPDRPGPRAPAAPPAAPITRGDRARRRQRKRIARRSGPGAPQSEVCCCFDRSTPRSSLHRSLSPWRSVNVRTSFAAILVHRTGATVMPRLYCSTATSNRAKCISFTTSVSASICFRFGQSKPRPPRDGGTSCTRCACPSPARKLHEAKPVAMRIEPHRFSVDRDHRAEVQAVGQIVPMLVDRRVRHELRAAHGDAGAQEKTRTFTTLRPQVPETCASTNSATWATGLPRQPNLATGAEKREARDVAPAGCSVNRRKTRPGLLSPQSGADDSHDRSGPGNDAAMTARHRPETSSPPAPENLHLAQTTGQ